MSFIVSCSHKCQDYLALRQKAVISGRSESRDKMSSRKALSAMVYVKENTYQTQVVKQGNIVAPAV